MNEAGFEQRRGESWRDLERIVDGLERRKPAPGVEELPQRFRAACNDLALARHRMYGGGLIERLNGLVIRGYKQLYRVRRRGTEVALRFVLAEFPARVRREWRLFWLCSVMFWLPCFAMMWVAGRDLTWVQAILGSQGMQNMESMYGGEAEQLAHLREEFGSNFMMFAFYINNNVGIDFQIFAGGIAACLGTIFFLVYNGLAIGAAAGYVNVAANPESFWSFVAGHSSFELLGMVVAGMAGMRVGLGVLRPGRMTRTKSIAAAAREALPLIFGAAGMTVLAAVVEGFWSARPLPAELKYAVGIGFWVLHAAYFLLLGRRWREA